jgi:site-specific DNA recombinase
VPENPTKKDGYKKIKKTSRRSKPENEWIKITSIPIIDIDLFNCAGQRLRSNFEASVRNTKNE